MTTRKTSFLLATTSMAALSMFALGGMGSAPGLAQCTGPDPLAGGGVLGTADPDVLTCEDVTTDPSGNEVFGLGDGDTITIAGSSVGPVDGGTGNDTITLKAFTITTPNTSISRTSVAPEVRGGADNDTILIRSSFIDGAGVFGDGGNDTITVTAFSTVTAISGGGGNDSITLGNATVQFDLLGGVGNDRILLLGGLVAGSIEGNENDDIIQVFGGTVGDGGADDDVLGGSGDDSIEVIDAKIFGDVEGNANDDTIVIGGAASIGGSVFGDNETDGDVGEDRIAIAGTATIAGGVFGDTGTAFDADGLSDEIAMTGGTIDGDVLGQGGDDTIFQDGANIAGDIQGGLGDDTITLRDGTVTNVWGDAFDGASQAGNGNDLIRLGLAPDIRMARVLGDIVSGAGNDTVNMFRGTVDGDVLAGSGEDRLLVTGSDAMIGGSVIGDSGNDTIEMTAGMVEGSLLGGSDDDALFMGGGSVGGTVDGESGNDLVELTGGAIDGDALGGSGDDMGRVGGTFDFATLGGKLIGDQGSGNTGQDTLTFDDWVGAVVPDDLVEWDQITITDGSDVIFQLSPPNQFATLDNGDGDIELFIDNSSEMSFEDIGLLIIEGNVQNNGSIDLAGGGDVGSVVLIRGDYDANSALFIDTFLDDGKTLLPAENSDFVSIIGDVSGETEIFVTPVMDSPGGLTGFGPEDGILVVDASSSDEDAFSLGNFDLTAGIFEYFLVNPEGQPPGQDNWYLQSDYLDQIYVYENLPGAMQTIGSALTGQLVERVGVRSAVPSSLPDADGNPVRGGAPVDTALWARAVGLSLESDGDIDSTTNGSFDQTIGFIQGGGEVVVSQSQSGRLLIGALGHWGTSSLDADNSRGADVGTANFDFYGGGLTATWYGTGGLYLDAVAQYTAYDIDISTATRWPSQSTDGWGVSVSGEAGYRIPIGATAALVPQGQLTWQTLDFDDFTDPDGVRVSLNDDDSLVGRLGVAFENNAAIGSSLATGYVEANVMYEFLGDNSVNTFTPEGGNIALNQQTREAWVEVGFGGTIAVAEGVSLYGEVDYALPFDGGVRGVQAVGGIRVNLNPPPAPPPPAPVIAPVAETAFIVFFDWDRADLTSEANLVLDDVVVVANQSGYASIRLDGYTDLSGSAQYNLGLSERRANSVANGLIARGIAPDEIVIRAFGEENPLVPTPDGVREPQNRRVEIFLS